MRLLITAATVYMTGAAWEGEGLVFHPKPKETRILRVNHTSIFDNGTGIYPASAAIVFVDSHF